jgi:hypothetical protein
MQLTDSEIQKIYNDFENRSLDLKEMKQRYGIDTGDYHCSYYINIEFHRGGHFREKGLLTLEEYIRAEYLLNKNKTLYLGEVNGKHSDVEMDANDISFSFNINDIQDCIKKGKYGSSFDFIFDQNEKPKITKEMLKVKPMKTFHEIKSLMKDIKKKN